MSNNSLFITSRQIDRAVWESLDPLDQATLARLAEGAKGHAECWRGNEWLAAKLKRSVRWVQQRIARLKRLGIIETVVDYSIDARRRIVLLWRKPAEPAPAPETRPEPTEGAMNHVPADLRDPVAPPRHAAPQAAAASRVDAPRERVAEGRKATPEEVARVVSEAAKLRGGEPERVRSLMRVAGADVVGKAVAWAVKRGKASFRWVESTAPAWKAEGVPDYAKEARSEEDEFARQVAAIERLFGRGGICEQPGGVVAWAEKQPWT